MPGQVTSRSNVYTGKWWPHSTGKEEEDMSEFLGLWEAGCVTFGNHPNCLSPFFLSEKNILMLVLVSWWPNTLHRRFYKLPVASRLVSAHRYYHSCAFWSWNSASSWPRGPALIKLCHLTYSIAMSLSSSEPPTLTPRFSLATPHTSTPGGLHTWLPRMVSSYLATKHITYRLVILKDLKLIK